MLSFLHPFAFIALFGLLVPLVIHLWERRQGRRVLVGSIRLLEEADEQRINHLQLTDLWRLLLRMLILLVFVFLLAGPVWEERPAAEAPRHWVLLTPGLTAEGALLTYLDSLRVAGRPVRVLAPGFPEWTAERDAEADGTADNYWSLLRELGRQPAAPDTVTIFGDPLLRHFRGERPALPMVVRWQSLPAVPAVPFLAAAWRQEDKVEVLLGLSGQEGTLYQRHTVPAQASDYPLPEPFPSLLVEEGRGPEALEALLAGHPDSRMPVGAAPEGTIRIFYDRQRGEELPFLEAALRAAAAFTGLKIDLLAEPTEALAAAEAAEHEWLFWLSDQKVPPAAEAWAPGLVVYRPSPLYPERYLLPEAGRVILQRPLLPAGADLDIDERLPAELIDLLFGDEQLQISENDRRLLAEAQLRPAVAAGQVKGIVEEAEKQSLRWPLWWLLLALFLTERLLAARPELKNKTP